MTAMKQVELKNKIEWSFNGITIRLRCPKCGKVGKLISKGRSKLSDRPKLMVRHEKGACNIGKCSEHYDELLDIYIRCCRIRHAQKRQREIILKRMSEL